ncbi:putative membrane protein [Pseudorhizobium tarimense]|uniref:Membrane protein n=1 Tax=Pseudorhizobium tarimense TaxID=1079109 RepID=A0ABV2H332_9HYPH|nr:DUF389 domain-containing protein [Pseudorhizobium tarimense]
MSGAVAAFGIVSDTIHIVIGAMLIAPGFEPLLRVIFGVLDDRHSVTAGLRANAYGYLALAASAAVATPVALLVSGTTVDQLAAGYWANYWSRIEASGIATSLVAGFAGWIIVSSRMKVLGTGVMVALALIPAMALVGIGLATGLPHLMLGGASRWVAEVLCVLVSGGLIILFKRKLMYRGASD